MKIETPEDMAKRAGYPWCSGSGRTSMLNDAGAGFVAGIRADRLAIAAALETYARSICQPEGQLYARQLLEMVDEIRRGT